MRIFVFAILPAIFLSACAATYAGPALSPVEVSEPISTNKSDVFAAAKRALTLDGYQLVSSDEGAGVISAGPRQVRLTVAEADCGTTMGLPYLKDKRTTTRVTVGVIIDDARIRVTTNIEGEYLKGNVTQSISLDCVSTGLTERKIMAKIRAQTN